MAYLQFFFFFFLTYFLSINNLKAQEKIDSLYYLNIQVNQTVLNQEGIKEKLIIKNWKAYLNSGTYKEGFYTPKSTIFWSISNEFPYPANLLSDLGFSTYHIKFLNQNQVSIVALYPIKKDTFVLKTAFYYYNDSLKYFILEHIHTVYASCLKDSVKFFTSPEWYSIIWNKKQVGDITYYYPKDHDFNTKNALKLDSFNKSMAKLFKFNRIKFKFFLCKNNSNVEDVLGYDFSLLKYVPNQIGGVTSPTNSCVIAGNGTEYYPHEVVHLYNAQVFQKTGKHFHLWFDEGIAALFGGSRDQTLEWHLKKLKTYLGANPQEDFKDLFSLTSVPNGEFTTEYNYCIGGLVCKKIYKKEGMDGLLDLLQSGNTDDDFYKAVEKHLGVKKDDLGTFIRKEIQEY